MNYDAIVIGSGIGGLAYAATMATMANQKVLLLEKHFTPGGYTHTFQRKNSNKQKIEFDVGIHYVGRMGQGSLDRAFSDFVSEGRLEWAKIEEPFDVFEYPGYRFEHTSGSFIEDLVRDFPHQSEALEQYDQDLRRGAKWIRSRFMSMSLRAPLNRMIQEDTEFCMQTTQEYLDAHFTDEVLKAVLASRWGDYGMPPESSPFFLHAATERHFAFGGYYPVGGSSAIAKSILPTIESRGGEIRKAHDVRQILVEKNRAIGVEVYSTKHGVQHLFAPKIISNAGAFNTYTKLLSGHGSDFARDENNAGISALTLYFGLNDDPRKLNFNGANHWIKSDFRHRVVEDATLASGIPGAFLSISSLRDPTAKHHKGEVVVLADDTAFKRWEGLSWKERHKDQDYLHLKENISQKILDYIEGHHPGFRSMVNFHELSTPLSAHTFSQHPRGAIYGSESNVERYSDPSHSIHTPIKNLKMVGADSLTLGFLSSMMSGIGAAAHDLGYLGLPRIMRRVGKLRK